VRIEGDLGIVRITSSLIQWLLISKVNIAPSSVHASANNGSRRIRETRASQRVKEGETRNQR